MLKLSMLPEGLLEAGLDAVGLCPCYLKVSLRQALTYGRRAIICGVMTVVSPRTSCTSRRSVVWASGFRAKQYSVNCDALDV